jgi:hypothetical protein
VPVLIDLDVAPPTSRPRARRDSGRALKPAFLAALLLLLGGAALPDRPPGVTEVAGTGGRSVTTYLLTADALVTAQLRADGGTAIEAVPLYAGGPRWTTPVSADLPSLTLSANGATLVAQPRQDGRPAFIDVRTGRVRWQAPEYSIVRVLGDRVAVWHWVEGGDTGVLRMADAATGRTIWKRSADVMTLDGDESRVIAVDPTGQASAFAAADGRVLSEVRDLGIVVDAWDVDYEVRSKAETVIGDSMYWWTPAFVAAYRLPDLRPRWRVKVTDAINMTPCGTLVCVTGFDHVTAIDPVAGKVRWSGPWRSVTPDGVAVSADGQVARLDPATGRVVEQLGRGGPVGDLLLRLEPERVWVTGLTDRQVIGVIPTVYPAACRTAGRFLACQMTGQTVTVWRVRS